MNFDDELRDLLPGYADDAPDGRGTLTAVRAREHRLRVRRAGVATLLAVVAAVSTPYLLTSHQGPERGPVAVPPATGPSDTPPPIPTTPIPTTPPIPIPTSFSPVPVKPSKVRLVPAAFTPASFPMTPSSRPSGLMDPVVGIPDLQPMLAYYGTDYATTGRYLGVTSGKTAQDLGVDWPPDSTTAIDVNGHQAKLSTGTDRVSLTWRQRAGLWIGVDGTALTRAQVVQYARGLTAQPYSPPMPFHLGLAPNGYQPSLQEFHPESPSDGYHFCLGPPDQLLDQSSGAMVCVAANSDAATPQDGDPVRVGNDPGVLKVEGGLRTLQVLRPGFPFFVIQKTVATGGTLSDSDLIRFAAAIAQG